MYEKILFCDLKKNIFKRDIIDSVRIKYKVFNDIFDNKLHIGTLLFFYSYFNSILKYKNISKNNYTCYDFFISNVSIYTFNVFYNFIISFIYENYSNYFFVQTNSFSEFSLQFITLSNCPSNFFFNDIVSFNSLIHINFKTNFFNYFLNKVYLSHLFFNV